MRILTGKKWREGFLDYHQNKSDYRIQVLAWQNLERLENVYHTRPKSLRLLVNYFPVVGPEGMFTKVWSRIREERRNEKYVSCGVGKIIKSAADRAFTEGETVGFIAPLHPAMVERVTLPEKLIFKIEKSDIPELPKEKILYFPIQNKESRNGWWQDIRGWSIYSGIKISKETRNALANGLKKWLKETEWTEPEKIDARNATPITEIKGKIKKINPNKKSGVLFGYGNYAKINIIPYMKPFVDIQAVHEIDPTQIFLEQGVQKWDAAPFPRKDEKYDVYFVASYNHTHVPITLHALKQGAYALVEKPVVMDYEELAALEKALKIAGRKLFIGFHKRYGLFNKMALQDLNVTYGEPISYHSIVYELLQPEFFWYNWPVSRSTFLANGCHQIDHFLHLNNWSKPINADIKLLQDHAVLVWIELENGATFTTTFSEKGSLRVGPRDRVELKVHGRDVRITDAIHYVSEDNHRIIRKMRIFKTNSYKDMYREIGKKIANNEPGDSMESIMMSAKIMLDLEEKLQKMKGWGNRYERAKEEFSDCFF
ncbi:MAG: Oxidoreductase-like protein [Candidatus Jorgensenbacteria bacterium GW2011_GWA1_48_11]|uniref:Oxidoreductase-like protein n=1 Tax=Candidatus Jorgensenbacteria bacterium GW2011_GWA1_48_11 TaxID=1618660 RepID=A0A0G1UBH3_9BACT|nr:MAG: Oxidoreductase-like protein [Candidatus Jorgensenbacteria bacterium GW2011_GWA1_48_11]KKW11960.1 MAG: Oxidoreductase-like protein [Candidatus Jorgensenbacteria bacterium GW2011_GWB1_49_9]